MAWSTEPHVANPHIRLLRDLRLARNESLKALAARLGWSDSHLSLWERGLADPKLSAFIDWAQAFGFEVTLTKAGDA